MFICIHLSLFIHTIQNNTFLSSSSITFWKPDIFLVKVQNALCWWNNRALSLNEFQNFYFLAEFHGKNDQPRKNLDKLTIYFFLNRIAWALRWQTLSVSICCESINKSVSLFDTQFILDFVLLFLSSFSLTVFIKFFLIQKSKSSTNLNHKEGKQEETTID